MTSAIASAAYNAYQSLPTIRLATPKQVLDRVAMVAIPAIALFAATNMSTASADRFSECINSCDRNVESEGRILCYAICWIANMFARG